MEIEFIGAAREVTGSCHIVRANGRTVMLDCGMFQGKRSEADEKNRRLPLPIGELDAVILSHAKATVKSVREAGFAKNIDAIERNADFPLMQRMGIDFAFAGGKSQGEEFFEGASVLQRIPVVKQTVGKYVQKSDEVFGGGLDHLRASLAQLWIDQLRSQGVTYREHPEAYKTVGRFINIITGRADIGPDNSAVTRALLGVTKLIGFSPRYRLSRIQFLTLPFNPSFYQAHPAARRIVYKNVARYYGTLGATLGTLSALGYLTGALSVGFFDPEDDDWLKVKIGNLRLDLTAGNQTQARVAARLLGEGYRAATGEVTGKMAAGKSADIALRWLRSGTDPRASLTWDWMTGETFGGEPFHWGGFDGAIATRLMPISWANAVKTMQREGPAMTAGQMAADFVGVGSQVYPDRADEPKTKAERLASRFAAEGMKGGKPRTDEMRRKLDELKGRARKGEDVRSEVEPLVSSGEISEGHGESIIKAKDQTLLQEKIRQLSLEDAKHVLKYATPEEVESVKPILRGKALNEAAKKDAEERKRANPAKAEADRRRSERAKERKKRKQEVRYGREVSP